MLRGGDGFSHYDETLLSSKWDHVANITGIDAAYGRYANGCRTFGAPFQTIGQASLGKNLGSTITGRAFFGLSFRITTMPSQGVWILHAVYDITPSGNMKVCTGIGADGSLKIGWITVNNFSTIWNELATSAPGVVVANTYYHGESAFLVRAVDGEVIISINGAQPGDDGYLAFTGNTMHSTGSNYFADSSSEQFTHVRVCGVVDVPGGSLEVDITDFHWQDDVDDGIVPRTDTLLGDVDLGVINALSDEGPNDWTPNTGTDHFELINDATPDDQSTYLSSDTPGNEELFDMENIRAGTRTIFGLLLNARVAKDASGARSYSTRIKPAGGASTIIDTRTAPSTWVNQQDVSAESLVIAGTRWSAAQINTIGWLAGFKDEA